ncbi:MAG TPA: flagellar biosynthetic protein FliR [Caulobacteraceae bacterium]|jgi:flagellar biosynthetic protein FliR|nr:flagellar biosynthetic protein FliR [Caulobacteraceae bacterium]
MPVESPIAWVYSSLLLSLRVSPVFALAPPFSLTRVPVPFRVLFGVGIAAALCASNPAVATVASLSPGYLAVTAARELLLGSIFVLAFQLAFAALYMAGRTVDIQAGFGLAVLIDPTTRAQTPLVGTLFAYAAGVVFFSLDGHADLLRIMGASLQAIPLGAAIMPASLAPLASFISVVFILGLGAAGGAILGLFLADMAIAMLSRTAPQLNVLVLGLQVKTLLLLLILPVTFGVGGALLARLMRVTLESLPRLL